MLQTPISAPRRASSNSRSDRAAPPPPAPPDPLSGGALLHSSAGKSTTHGNPPPSSSPPDQPFLRSPAQPFLPSAAAAGTSWLRPRSWRRARRLRSTTWCRRASSRCRTRGGSSQVKLADARGGHQPCKQLASGSTCINAMQGRALYSGCIISLVGRCITSSGWPAL